MPKNIYKVGVYTPRQPSSTEPRCYLDLADALELVTVGAAFRLSKYRIRLKDMKTTPQMRGLSCKMGERAIIALVGMLCMDSDGTIGIRALRDRQERATATVEAWNGSRTLVRIMA